MLEEFKLTDLIERLEMARVAAEDHFLATDSYAAALGHLEGEIGVIINAIKVERDHMRAGREKWEREMEQLDELMAAS